MKAFCNQRADTFHRITDLSNYPGEEVMSSIKLGVAPREAEAVPCALRADQPDGMRVRRQPLPMLGLQHVLPRLHRRPAVPLVLLAASVLIVRNAAHPDRPDRSYVG